MMSPGVRSITTAKTHSIIFEVRLCPDLNLARCVSEVNNDKKLCQ